MFILLSLGLALVAGDLVDRCARPGRSAAEFDPSTLLLRGTTVVWIWMTAMAVSQRPLFAAFATVVTVAVLVVVSNQKMKALREPLVFSDFAFLGAVARYPHLFYLDAVTMVLIGLATAAAAGVTAAWWLVESRTLSAGGVGLAVAGALALSALPLVPRFGAWAATLLPAPARDAHLPRFGLLASLLAHATAWVHQPRGSTATAAAHKLEDRSPYEAVVVIQAESFVDMRRHGFPDLALPAYDGLKARAVAAGLLDVPCFGAYTLRPEAAVLTGFGFEGAGCDGFNPYLRGERFAASAIPNRLPPSWRAHFIHPFDRTFFRRDRVMSAFGFASFADRSAFSDNDRVGPYVGDLAVGRHLIAVLGAARQDGVKPFVHVVTMEAHDPYLPDRIAEARHPTQQYLHHLANADRMLALVADELDREWDRVLLVHYGDHAPLLADAPGLFQDTRTDGLVVELGRCARQGSIVRTLDRPEDLHGLILDVFA